MSRSNSEILADITDAIAAIHSHLGHGPITVDIVMDAVAMRLLEIGEAVKALSPDLTAAEAQIPWADIAGMRDFLAHHYFATNPEIVQAVIDKDLRPLSEAVERLAGSLPPD
ncbi:HepT-like ribonuclease domain-containing protein [Kribbia dieselivorans]|uniref:HepT-like ribonuclease domain-containing protein n=1 Tax=Kribbia dieselivorans TaxID=331526 RepID=UPI0008389F2D|nr:HepT-like ribonuclease domain-containing protein [Kribbia dieselivorans]